MVALIGYVCGECGERFSAAGTCPTHGGRLDATDDPFIGSVISRYRLARLLGRGGMGRVYLGVQPSIGARVAVKILSQDCMDSPELVARFFAEARAANLIHHESIINMLDLDQLPDGRPYIVMEYIPGSTLRDVTRAGNAPLAAVAAIIVEVLLALDAAHAVGIIHRDLKPDNVMITPAGHAKVLDFGIAKLARPLGPRTATGAAIGTPMYMAPEQIRGDAIDARTDIYAVGVLLFEAMTGVLPFDGDTDYQQMQGHLEEPPRSPRAFRPAIPLLVEQVILQALAKRPEERFAGAKAMARALRHAAAELPSDPKTMTVSLIASVMPDVASAVRVTPIPTSRSPQSLATVVERRAPAPRDRGPTAPSAAPTPTAPTAAIAAPIAAPRTARVPGPTRGGSARWALVAVGAFGAGALGVTLAIRARSASPASPAPSAPTALSAPPGRRDAPVIAAMPAVPIDAAVTPADALAVVAVVAPIAPSVGRLHGGHKHHGLHAAPPPPVPVPPVPTPPVPAKPTPPVPAEPTSPADIDIVMEPAPKNLERFDPIAFYPHALALARNLAPDAELRQIIAEPVSPTGTVDLTSAYTENIYTFMSPAHADVPEIQRKSGKRTACSIEVTVGAHEVTARYAQIACGHNVPLPHCTLARIRKALFANDPPDAISRGHIQLMWQGRWEGRLLEFEGNHADARLIRVREDKCDP